LGVDELFYSIASSKTFFNFINNLLEIYKKQNKSSKRRKKDKRKLILTNNSHHKKKEKGKCC
jgi:hypothetical protein